jgi:hypothetical protein
VVTVRQNIDDSVCHFCDDVCDVEARLVSAGWHDPSRLYAASVKHGLSGESFIDRTVGKVFAVLLGCAVTGHPPTMRTGPECM